VPTRADLYAVGDEIERVKRNLLGSCCTGTNARAEPVEIDAHMGERYLAPLRRFILECNEPLSMLFRLTSCTLRVASPILIRHSVTTSRNPRSTGDLAECSSIPWRFDAYWCLVGLDERSRPNPLDFCGLEYQLGYEG
jgi:hypothetical protein